MACGYLKYVGQANRSGCKTPAMDRFKEHMNELKALESQSHVV